MANIIDNPLLLTSTTGNIQVLDSWGNVAAYPGGAGAAPDNWWFLGGPDYGTFLNAGGVWDTRQTPDGGRSILLDIKSELVRQSGGITQVVPLNQTEIKPVRMSAYVAAEGCTGPPRVNASFVGYPPGWPGAGGGDLVFDTGTYDFVYKKNTFLPSRPVKYLFLHLLHRGFSQGKAWYGNFTLEELALNLVALPPKNCIINPNFFYTGDDIAPTGWNIFGAVRTDEISPLGANAMLLKRNSSIMQRNICIDCGVLKQKITVYAMSYGTAILRLKITLRDRYRRVIDEKTVDIQADSRWKAVDVYVLSTAFAEKVDLEIANIDGDAGYIGGVLLTSEDFAPSKIIDVSAASKTVTVPPACTDTTAVIAAGGAINPKHVEFDTGGSNNTIYLTDGLIGGFAASAVHKPPVFCQRSAMTKLSDTDYTLDPWPDGINSVETDDREIEPFLGIPHVVHPDKWLLTSSGSIPAKDTRYYCVTAFNENGETDRSNEVRAITSQYSNTNRVPVEICPVAGAAGYRVYMTRHEDAEQPWEYSVAGIKKLIWDDGQDHLVAEVTAEQLRNAGYIVYDTGSALSSGCPPAVNTAARWNVDNVNNKVVFDANSVPAGTVTAVYPVAENVKAIFYLPHADKFYLAGEAGIYQSDIFTPGKLTLIAETADIAALSYYNELWYMTAVGDVKNLAGTTYPGDAGFTGFCFTDNAHIARISAAGAVAISDLAGNVTTQFMLAGLTSCSGLAMYFDKLVTYDSWQDKFIVFNQSGSILQAVDTPVSGIAAWNISGVNLAARTSFADIVFRIHAENYYAKLDKGYYLGGDPQQPEITRAKLPGEVTDPVYPELLPNGTFQDGTTFPAGFSIYGPSEIETGFSTEVAVPGTRALYFAFPASSWKSVNKYGVPVVGGRQYSFSVNTKATAISNGLLGITFRDKDGLGNETFYTVQYEPAYELRQVVMQAPVEAVTVDFRYLAYGSDTQGITYFLNALSLKEEESPQVTFEHLYNGDFSISPTGANMPSGFEIAGDGADDAVTAIEIPAMQTQGRALRITLPSFEVAGWTALQSQPFAVEEGDNLEVSFYYRRGKSESAYIQVSLYYLLPNGDWGISRHKTVSLAAPTGTNILKAVFDPNPAGYPMARLRIWPEFDDWNWIEGCSVKPVVSLSGVVNPDFSAQLAGWDRWGTDMQDKNAQGLGTSLESALFHTRPYCVRFDVDRIACKYAELRQAVVLNQTTPKKVSFSAWGAGSSIIGGGVFFFEVWIRFTDGTSVWNPCGDAQKLPGGTFGWTQLQFEYTPPKPIKDLDVIIDLGWGGTGTAWLDDVSVVEAQDVPAVDAVVLDVPYTELNTETVRQIKLSAQIKNGGDNVNQKGINVIFEADPAIGSFEVLATNAIGKARAIYTLPETAGQVTLKAAYGASKDAKVVTIYPLMLSARQEPRIGELPRSLNRLYAEIIVPLEPKPLPDVTERIGRWEVFRPTVYNARQMSDYDLHYSPITDWSHVKPGTIAQSFPALLLFHYFDDLSDYPHQTGWQEITAQRKEWFCLDATGFSSPFGDGRYYYNWRNMEAVQWYVDRLIRDHAGWSDGIYIDDFWGESYNTLVEFEWGAEASQLLNYRSVRERLEASANRIRLLRDELHRRGKYLTTNFGCARKFNADGTLVKDTELLALPFDGYLLECWLYTWTVNPEEIADEGFDLTYVKNEIDFVKWAGDNGKWVVCLARSSSEMYPARMFSLAAFIMGKHSRAFCCHSDWGPNTYGSDWHEQMQPECFINTGLPQENYQLNDGLFTRRFDNCVALLNMGDTARDYVLPEGTWYTMRGDSYSGSIAVARRQGLVLVKERP